MTTMNFSDKICLLDAFEFKMTAMIAEEGSSPTSSKPIKVDVTMKHLVKELQLLSNFYYFIEYQEPEC